MAGELEHTACAPARAHAARGHGPVDPHDPAISVEPDEVEREAHAERVHGAAARDLEGYAGREGSAADEAEQAARPTGDDQLHGDERARARMFAPGSNFGIEGGTGGASWKPVRHRPGF